MREAREGGSGVVGAQQPKAAVRVVSVAIDLSGGETRDGALALYAPAHLSEGVGSLSEARSEGILNRQFAIRNSEFSVVHGRWRIRLLGRTGRRAGATEAKQAGSGAQGGPGTNQRWGAVVLRCRRA